MRRSSILSSQPPHQKSFFLWRVRFHAVPESPGLQIRDLWFRDMRLYQSRLASWLSGPVNSWLVKCSAALVTVSRGLRDRLSGYTGRDVLISYNGFFEADRHTPPHSQPRSDGKLHIVYTGRLYPGKRDRNRCSCDPLTQSEGFRFRYRIVVDFYGFDDPWLRGLIRDLRTRQSRQPSRLRAILAKYGSTACGRRTIILGLDRDAG